MVYKKSVKFYAFPNAREVRKHILTQWEGDHINFNIKRIKKLYTRMTCFKYKSNECDFMVYFERK